MTFSQYGIQARIMPAILCSVPFLIFYYWYLSPALSGMFSFFADVKLVSNISFPIVLIFLFSMINRHLSKVIFQKFYFGDELYMPTTNFLMYSDSQYTNEYKNAFRNKIFADFGIRLLEAREESENEISARKRIIESMSLIRKRGDKSKMLLQHNIEYGFFRNLIGGSVIAAPFSLILALYGFIFTDNTIAVTSLFLCFVIFFLFILFSKNLINEHGIAYAKILFQEYMSS